MSESKSRFRFILGEPKRDYEDLELILGYFWHLGFPIKTYFNYRITENMEFS